MSSTRSKGTKGTTAKAGRWILALAIIGIAVGVYVLRPAAGEDSSVAANRAAADVPATTETGAATDAHAAEAAVALPRLLDLGADKCVPCKMMAPMLDKLREDYAGRMRVDFVDVWKTPDAGKPYNLKLIPTQIFFAPDGTELYRHEGFISREDILAKWNELGYAL
jgi:thioredoxin 1